MPHHNRLRTWPIAWSLTVGVASVGVLFPGIAAAQATSAQVISVPLELPKGPGTPGFDVTRLNTENYGAFEPFYVRDTQTLSKVLEEGKVAADTRLLVTETAAGRLALLTDQMAYHHLAQGREGGKDWMATFWVVCNSGTSLVPTIDGTTHHFYHVGIHDALFVMQDAETKTLWNHITGKAVYGRLIGRTLGPVGNLLHMTVKQALAADPTTRMAISDQRYLAGGRQFGSASRGPRVGGGGGGEAGVGGGRGLGPSTENPNAAMADRFAATLGTEDPRRPRMDIGLGIWSGVTARYYPMERIRGNGGVFVDRLDGKNVLVYIEPESSTPAALFVDARNAKREGAQIHLDDGSTVKSGVLIDRRGQPSPAKRPQQMFTRWYGFSLTFPGCEVFGQ